VPQISDEYRRLSRVKFRVKVDLLVLGGAFFLFSGILAIIVTVIRDSPSGLLAGGNSIIGATLGSLLGVLVGVFLIRLGTKRGKFSKRSR
jgi:hypothetical protein